jgi:thioredoxin-like negative regulator of GroEL
MKFQLAQPPVNHEVQRRMAREFQIEGKKQQAAEVYLQLLQANPRDTEALGYLAHHYLEGGVYNHAASLFNSLLAVQPQHKAAGYHLSARMSSSKKCCRPSGDKFTRRAAAFTFLPGLKRVELGGPGTTISMCTTSDFLDSRQD